VNGKLAWLVPPPPFPVPDPGEGGLKTLMLAVPEMAIRAALTVAWTCVALALTVAKVVCVPLGTAPHKTCEPPDGSDVGRKLLPVTVNVNAAPPAVAQAGARLETIGSGLPGGLMMNASGFESPLVPAPEWGCSVLTNAVPGFASSDAGTVAEMLPPTTLPLTSVCTCVAMVLPFHCTTVLATNPLPVTVSVNCWLPAVAFAGESEEMDAPVGTWKVFP
jgi:hypothetical protein